jgi:hypothetical protein
LLSARRRSRSAPLEPAADGAPPPPQREATVVLDGANLMWGYGLALTRRFGCKVYPAAQGLLLALDYEVRRRCRTFPRFVLR